MDAGGCAVAVPGAAVLTTIRTVAQTGSTNADLLALAASGAEEGLWLRAERQTAGRGRQGRPWISEPGNLYASTLVRLRPSDPPAATLALVAGVALYDSVGALFPGVTRSDGDRSVEGAARSLELKWPNDLLLGGAKVAGILLERAGDTVVVGIGLNMAHHPDLAERPTTSLAARGASIGPDVMAEVLADAFVRQVGRWRGEGLPGIRSAWTERAHPVGTALTARLPDGEAVEGLFDGLNSDGALTLRLASGERRVIHAGDIFLL